MDLRQIGTQMKAARLRQNLSQSDLASPLGMSRATISAIERGRIGEIGVRKLAALCEALGLELTLQPRRSRPTLDDIREERRNDKARS